MKGVQLNVENWCRKTKRTKAKSSKEERTRRRMLRTVNCSQFPSIEDCQKKIGWLAGNCDDYQSESYRTKTDFRVGEIYRQIEGR